MATMPQSLLNAAETNLYASPAIFGGSCKSCSGAIQFSCTEHAFSSFCSPSSCANDKFPIFALNFSYTKTENGLRKPCTMQWLWRYVIPSATSSSKWTLSGKFTSVCVLYSRWFREANWKCSITRQKCCGWGPRHTAMRRDTWGWRSQLEKD